jgi:hypothetical protein
MPTAKEKTNPKKASAPALDSLRGSGADWFSQGCDSLAITVAFPECDAVYRPARLPASPKFSPALKTSVRQLLAFAS